MNVSKPKYLQVYDAIKYQIRNQTYQVGELLPAEAELCAVYKTSRPTIAKALNLLSNEKIVHRKAGFGTQVLPPQISALKVGLLIPQLTQTEIFEPICSSITECAHESGMHIVRPPELGRAVDFQKMAESLMNQFISMKVDGVFFTPVEYIQNHEDFNLRIIDRLGRAGISVVLLDRDVYPWPRQTPYDLVGIDNIEAGFMVAGHLIGNGCRRIGFVSEANPAMTVQLRQIGVREALIQNGFRARDLVNVSFDAADPKETVDALQQGDVDGVVCANDATAARLLRVLVDHGIRIPSQMQVCGFDDVKYASLLTVPLTSYQQPCGDIGKVAVNTMITRIQHPDRPAHRITLKGRLIPRNSSLHPDRVGAAVVL
ncbi:GntR family transcriptional regulator [Coraliomargarita sp. SDUM461004]|uniref:GntR family transcriptional regulator n=1 Tax=Thalassobacterium sedimentorum TaxID=3041258 RepID=A0ABU1ALD0_9BACT|nr:GntR family transcriptional regulator [Coraliomargarita sp. SDUM461004]MDQ8195612.1 GntR family transcriptional regulator [Coraliomargarita sp. SDUM461004]